MFYNNVQFLSIPLQKEGKTQKIKTEMIKGRSQLSEKVGLSRLNRCEPREMIRIYKTMRSLEELQIIFIKWFLNTGVIFCWEIIF